MADNGEANGAQARSEPTAGVSGNPAPVLEPFMGMKVRRRSSVNKIFKGDYLNLTGNQAVVKTLSKHGDEAVLFADRILKVNRRGKMVSRLLLITNLSLYILEPETFRMCRRIFLPLVESMHLSEFDDNFFAIIVPTEYDCLLASTRKTEIATVLVEATKNLAGKEESPLQLNFSNSFEYGLDAETVRQVQFEQTSGGVSTKVVSVGPM